MVKTIVRCNDCYTMIIFKNSDEGRVFIGKSSKCPVCHKGRLSLMKVLLKIIEL